MCTVTIAWVPSIQMFSSQHGDIFFYFCIDCFKGAIALLCFSRTLNRAEGNTLYAFVTKHSQPGGYCSSSMCLFYQSTIVTDAARYRIDDFRTSSVQSRLTKLDNFIFLCLKPELQQTLASLSLEGSQLLQPRRNFCRASWDHVNAHLLSFHEENLGQCLKDRPFLFCVCPFVCIGEWTSLEFVRESSVLFRDLFSSAVTSSSFEGQGCNQVFTATLKAFRNLSTTPFLIFFQFACKVFLLHAMFSTFEWRCAVHTTNATIMSLSINTV